MAAVDESTPPPNAVAPLPPPSRTLQWTLWSALALTIFGIVTAFIYQQWNHAVRRQFPTLEQFNQVPPFQFTERSGKPFDSAAELNGKIWVADFFFSTCPGPCLRMNGRMAEIQQALSGKNAGVRLVSFTIYPQYDTPEVLRRYAERFQASPDRWFFLTGDKTKIYDLAKDTFLLGVTDSATGKENLAQGEFIHSTKLVLVDRQGVIRGYYDSSNPEVVQQLLTDLSGLLHEQPPPPKS